MSIILTDDFKKSIDKWVITDQDLFPFLCLALGKLPPLKKKKKTRHKGFRTCYSEYQF